MTRYITLADYVWLAEPVTGLLATVLSKAGRLDLADSALHAPAAGFETTSLPGPVRQGSSAGQQCLHVGSRGTIPCPTATFRAPRQRGECAYATTRTGVLGSVVPGASLVDLVNLCGPSIDAAQLPERRRELPSGWSLTGREVHRIDPGHIGNLPAMAEPAATSGVNPAGVSGVKRFSKIVVLDVANQLFDLAFSCDPEHSPGLRV